MRGSQIVKKTMLMLSVINEILVFNKIKLTQPVENGFYSMYEGQSSSRAMLKLSLEISIFLRKVTVVNKKSFI